jgi:hypothetical protein
MIADASLGSSGCIATKPFIAHKEGNFPSLRKQTESADRPVGIWCQDLATGDISTTTCASPKCRCRLATSPTQPKGRPFTRHDLKALPPRGCLHQTFARFIRHCSQEWYPPCIWLVPHSKGAVYADRIHVERKAASRGRAAPDAAAVGTARHAGPDGHEVRPRSGALRRVHGPLRRRAVRSCQTAVQAVAGKRVTTVEGLSADGTHPVQRAWIEEDVPQCGYCQSGQMMSAAALLTTTAGPSDLEIDRAMRGNICRCGTYSDIRRAIHRAAG